MTLLTTFAAGTGLVAGLTACSSPHSNDLRNKPIRYEILDVD